MKFNLSNRKKVYLELNKILRNKNSIIVSGGNTIKDLLKKYKHKILCRKILLSDERLVKKHSNLRNDKFFEKLIKKNILNSRQLINFTHEYFNKKKINNFSNKISKLKFDYAILSLGVNGHFASIFELNKNNNDFYYINNSPKFPKERVTVSLGKISKCKKIFFLAERKKKKKEISNFNKNKLIQKLPKKKVYLFTF